MRQPMRGHSVRRSHGAVVTVKKSLNSSVVLVETADGAEAIVMDKGIGYGRRGGDVLTLAGTEHLFIPIEGVDARELQTGLEGVRPEFIRIAHAIVSRAETDLGVDLHPYVYVVLPQHLAFAVERAGEDLPVRNRLAWEIETFYAEEFACGCYGIDLVRQELSVHLPRSEAANIAFHLVNAHNGHRTNHFDAFRAAHLIGEVTSIIQLATGVVVSAGGTAQQRLITHIRFFAERFWDGRLLDEEDAIVYTRVGERYPQALEVARRVADHVYATYGTQLPLEEVGYLGLHVARLLRS